MRTPTAGIILALLTAVFCSACDSVPPDYSTYHSKLGNFTCTVPRLIRPGAVMVERTTDDTTFVTFSDDFGTLFRIESIRIPPDQKQLLASGNVPVVLSAFFHQELMPREFMAVSTQTTIVDEDYVDTAAGKALFAVVNIPHGSTLKESVNGGPYVASTSVRGVMVFQQHDFLYILMNQEWPMATDRTPPIPMQTRISMRLDDLQKPVAGMNFQ